MEVIVPQTIVVLPQEHYYCHKLLAIQYPENDKLQFAWWYMCHYIDADAKRVYDVSAEDYCEAKQRIADSSAKMNGIPVVDIENGKVYSSAEEAARLLNIRSASNVILCCKGKQHSANKHKFCYLKDYLAQTYVNLPIGHNRRVIDLDTLIVYESSIEAGDKLGILPKNIRRACNGSRKSASGHRFAYYNDYLSNNYTIKSVAHEDARKPVKELTSGVIYNSIAEAAEQLLLDSSSISKVCRGMTKSTKGYKFVYYLEDNNGQSAAKFS